MGRPDPCLVSVEMGYGHLRAAWPLAERFGVAVERADRGPLASPGDALLWRSSRRAYESLSRLSQWPPTRRACGPLLEHLTAIAPGTAGPGAGSHFLAACIERGFGRRLGRMVGAAGTPLVTTFYAPALAAERYSDVPVFCVVTDSDVHRVWAPPEPGPSRIHYLVPTAATASRLAGFGVAEHRLTVTGFPLPPALVATAGSDLERRLERLRCADGAPRLTFAVGGAGAQAHRARQLLAELADPLRSGRLRLALVAGLRPRLARAFRHWSAEALGGATNAVEVLEATGFEELYGRFNLLLARSDLLWTKPSELSFYAALGLPLILDDPVGAHERANARLVLEAGAAIVRPDPGSVTQVLIGGLDSGAFAAAARSGFEKLQRGGTEAIASCVFNHC